MSDLWVFAYGSLMWRPGFPFEEAVPAQIAGAHRSLCVYSIVHRGSPRRPGLVLGLDAGGSCNGLAFRVRSGLERRTRKYLRAREQVTRVYREAVRPIRLLDGGRLNARAVCFLVDNTHRQYAGKLPLTAQAFLVRHGEGRSGPNPEYVANTVRHLDDLGIDEPHLKRLLPMIGIRNSGLDSLPCERDMSIEC